MGCIHTSNSSKSRITIRVMELNYYIDIFNQSVIWRVRGLESFNVIEMERVNSNMIKYN